MRVSINVRDVEVIIRCRGEDHAVGIFQETDSDGAEVISVNWARPDGSVEKLLRLEGEVV